MSKNTELKIKLTTDELEMIRSLARTHGYSSMSQFVREEARTMYEKENEPYSDDWYFEESCYGS